MNINWTQSFCIGILQTFNIHLKHKFESLLTIQRMDNRSDNYFSRLQIQNNGLKLKKRLPEEAFGKQHQNKH
jgi:hypothetical protein